MRLRTAPVRQGDLTSVTVPECPFELAVRAASIFAAYLVVICMVVPVPADAEKRCCDSKEGATSSEEEDRWLRNYLVNEHPFWQAGQTGRPSSCGSRVTEAQTMQA